jgi:hypothetical protein
MAATPTGSGAAPPFEVEPAEDERPAAPQAASESRERRRMRMEVYLRTRR